MDARPFVRTEDLADEAGTAALAASLGALLRVGDVVALGGPLGAGKTTFVRVLIAAALGAPTEVPSPTFTLVQVYDLPAGPLWHFDLYRLSGPMRCLSLGGTMRWLRASPSSNGPDRLGPLLPADRLEVDLDFGDREDQRKARLTGFGDWAARVKTLGISDQDDDRPPRRPGPSWQAAPQTARKPNDRTC